MYNRSILTSLFALAVLSTALAGCGTSSASSPTNSPQDQQEKTNNGAVLDQNGEK